MHRPRRKPGRRRSGQAPTPDVTPQPVLAVLLATARYPATSAEQRETLFDILSGFDEMDWSTLIEHALAHGSASLLCRHLLDLSPEFLPPGVATACEAFLATRDNAAADAMAQVAKVIDALAAHGIDSLPFKGPILGLQAYGDPAMRVYRDLDFLVRHGDVPAALAALGRLGYHSETIAGLRARRIADYYRYNGHDTLSAPGKLPIEPHWALSPHAFSAEIETDPIFDRATAVQTSQGRRFACFAPEDTLLAAALHGGKEQWPRLVGVADIAALLHAHPDLDWTATLARAREIGCLRMTLLAVELARALLGAQLPYEVRAAIAQDRAVAALAQRVRERLFAPTSTTSVFTFSRFRWKSREHLSDRFRCASRTLLAARVDRPIWRALNRARLGAESQPESPPPRVPYDPLATPDFFPMKIDSRRNTVLFVQMSRESFRQSAFLDQTIILSGKTTVSAAIPKLLHRKAELPMHFILHTGFCGSTLLARYFEELPRCLVLKEPMVLGELSTLRNDATPGYEPESWHDWFQVTFALLARGYPTNDTVIVKAPDCNWMGNLLLDHDARTKVIFLAVSLKVFLLQILKVEYRRQWLRDHMRQQQRPMAQVPFLSATVGTELTDGQSAAAMWLMNSFLCHSLLTRPDAHRVLVMNGEELISQPQPTVRAAAEFFGLGDDQVSAIAINMLRPSSQHSKDDQQPYDATTRAADLADAEARHGREMRDALAWARSVSSGWLAECPFPLA